MALCCLFKFFSIIIVFFSSQVGTVQWSVLIRLNIYKNTQNFAPKLELFDSFLFVVEFIAWRMRLIFRPMTFGFTVLVLVSVPRIPARSRNPKTLNFELSFHDLNSLLQAFTLIAKVQATANSSQSEPGSGFFTRNRLKIDFSLSIHLWFLRTFIKKG